MNKSRAVCVASLFTTATGALPMTRHVASLAVSLLPAVFDVLMCYGKDPEIVQPLLTAISRLHFSYCEDAVALGRLLFCLCVKVNTTSVTVTIACHIWSFFDIRRLPQAEAASIKGARCVMEMLILFVDAIASHFKVGSALTQDAVQVLSNAACCFSSASFAEQLWHSDDLLAAHVSALRLLSTAPVHVVIAAVGTQKKVLRLLRAVLSVFAAPKAAASKPEVMDCAASVVMLHTNYVDAVAAHPMLAYDVVRSVVSFAMSDNEFFGLRLSGGDGCCLVAGLVLSLIRTQVGVGHFGRRITASCPILEYVVQVSSMTHDSFTPALRGRSISALAALLRDGACLPADTIPVFGNLLHGLAKHRLPSHDVSLDVVEIVLRCLEDCPMACAEMCRNPDLLEVLVAITIANVSNLDVTSVAIEALVCVIRHGDPVLVAMALRSAFLPLPLNAYTRAFWISLHAMCSKTSARLST